MVRALQNTYLSWDLGAQVSYQAGQELQFTLHFSAPEAGKYYILGALYTKNLIYIAGTMFSIYVAEGVDYGGDSTSYASVWELAPAESVDLPCRLSIDRSDLVLGLFLFKMLGDVPSLGIDEQVASVSAELVSPVPAWMSVTEMAAMLLSLGMLGLVMSEASKV